MIIHYAARQAPPRPESIPKGPQVNQLTGEPPRQFPKYQGSGDFLVTMIEEPPPVIPPQPVMATGKNWDNGPDVQLIEEEPGALPYQQPSENTTTYRTPRRFRPGRSRAGSANGMAKLTEAAVVQIREQIREQAQNGVSQRKLAKIYQVSQATISDVVSGRTWQNIGETE